MGTAANSGIPNRKGFWALIATQFQGAFNDNLYRFVIVFYMIHHYATVNGVKDEAKSMAFTASATILFSVPFLLFPGLAGALADRYSKRTVIVSTKVWEILVMAFALAAFFQPSPVILFTLLFLMFTQSTFFSPAKYGILPEMMPERHLSWANGILNMTTFVAIIAGQALAGFLYEEARVEGFGLWVIGLVLLGLSSLGLISALGVTRMPTAAPERKIPLNPWSGLGRYFGIYFSDRVLFHTMLGGAYLWLVGAMVQQNVLVHGMTALALEEKYATFLSVSVILGIGTGSLAAGHLSRGRIEMGLIPIGLGGMAVTSLLLALPAFGPVTVGVLVLLTGFFGGFYAVPLAAAVQHRSPADLKGGMIATFNIATCVGVLLGGGIYLAASQAGMNTYQVFLLMSGLTVLTCLYLCWAMPWFVLRSILWFGMNTIYRIKVMGRENVPEKGGALLVANHMTFLDALFVQAALDRPIRFIMSAEFRDQHPWVRPLASLTGTIAISPKGTPKEIVTALRSATKAIEDGHLICVFAEGQISRTGQLLPFRKGFEKIMKGVDAPIVPIHLDQLWGSIFSFSDGKFFWKKPKQLPYPVTVSVGGHMPGTATAFDVRRTIQELGSEAYSQRELHEPILHRAFMRQARKTPFRKAIADATSGELSYFKTLVACIIFGRKLKQILGSENMVGVIVPPSVGGALTNIALLAMGKVPVNLNYTASNEAIASAAKQCGIKQVISAKKVLERLPIEIPGEAIFLEDIKRSVEKKDRILALLMAVFLPIRLIERALGFHGKPDRHDLATVIFSSGSEGEPKGVPLTHFNIASDIDQTLQIFPHRNDESMIGILPFFHSFGFTGTLWLTLSQGFSSVYHPSPLEAKAIGQLIQDHKCTILITAPTFLQNFVRRCLPEEFSSLRIVVTGAEKLPARLREAFRNKFGIEPLEGYGCTECAPIVSLNTEDHRAPGFFQRGTKHGTIGRPIPGDSIRIVDPDTGTIMPPGESGMLLVKGPNVMKGYLNMPEKSAEALHDGWYRTGDIAIVDEEGFITITDRLARFSKIAGEMVPHTRIEEELHRLIDETELRLAVTGLPDESKGERIVVLHTLEEDRLETLFQRIETSDLPNLWRPRANNFYRVEEIPILGTGKLDLRGVKNKAAEVDVGA